ncbi:MAG: hypothetical protein U0946_06920 [Patescibacteria group bacterium]|nr:hypothetical protein [Patescibacteria group bacterium]
MSLLQPESFDLAKKPETIGPDNFRMLFLDLDFMILAPPDYQRPALVATKVRTLNAILGHIASKTGTSFGVALCTQKPVGAFSSPEIGPIYAPLLNINSQILKPENIVSPTPLFAAFGEFGTTMLTPTATGWKKHINPQFLGLHADSQTLIDLLHRLDYISPTGDPAPGFPYRLEPFNDFNVSLQLPDGSPMLGTEKETIAEKIKQFLKKTGNAKLLKQFQITTDHNDVDIIPALIDRMTKLIGVQAITTLMHSQGFPWFSPKYICIADDKAHAADQATQAVLKAGGQAIIPANADPALQLTAGHFFPIGITSNHNVFIGLLDGLTRHFLHQPLTESNISLNLLLN